jgi:hypothetical protein
MHDKIKYDFNFVIFCFVTKKKVKWNIFLGIVEQIAKVAKKRILLFIIIEHETGVSQVWTTSRNQHTLLIWQKAMREYVRAFL